MNKIIKKKSLLVTIGVLSILGSVSLYNMDFIKSSFAFAGEGSEGIVNESKLAETYGGACGLCNSEEGMCNFMSGGPDCEGWPNWCDDEGAPCEADQCREWGTYCETAFPTYECADTWEACEDSHTDYECKNVYNEELERWYCDCVEKITQTCSERSGEVKRLCDHD